MSKRKTDWEELNRNKKARLDKIGSFWKNHYKLNVNDKSKLEASEVYKLFIQLNPGIEIDIGQFKSHSPALGVRSKKIRGKILYLAEPYSSSAVNFHSKVIQEKGPEVKNTAQIHLVNIQGLITNSKNKGEYLNLITNDVPKVVVVTETHLNRKKLHDNAEVKLGFPQFNLHRCDRDTEFDLSDEYQLSSHGGCMILTSPQLVSTKKLSFSNGNCEILIVGVPEIESHIVAVYKPPPPNYSLRKFQEVLTKIRKFLVEREKKDYRVVMMGDFNFPAHIVEWIKSEEGVFPFPKDGKTEEKIGFSLLSDLCNEFRLEQLVDRNTREKAILDLVYTDAPELFGECRTSSVKPYSDHNLVSFNLRKDIREQETVKRDRRQDTGDPILL